MSNSRQLHQNMNYCTHYLIFRKKTQFKWNNVGDNFVLFIIIITVHDVVAPQADTSPWADTPRQTPAPPPESRSLQRTVRILLECILVRSTNDLLCGQFKKTSFDWRREERIFTPVPVWRAHLAWLTGIVSVCRAGRARYVTGIMLSSPRRNGVA